MGALRDETDREWTEPYQRALADYLASRQEGALQRAFDLGRQAAYGQADLTSLIEAHHRMLARLLPQTNILDQAALFLAKTLQGYAQAVEELRTSRLDLEDRLHRQTAQLAAVQATLQAEIAERRLTEMALRDSEARFRVIFEKAGIGIGLLDKDGKIRESNPALEHMLGYRNRELHGRTLFDLTHPDDQEISRRLFRELVAGKHTHYQLEKRFLRRDGSLLWARKIVSGVYSTQGELQFAIDMIEDITDSKGAEMALKESEARFRQIADLAGEWIWEQDAEGRYLYSSSAVSEILGYQPEEILGKYYYELFTAEDRQRIAPSARQIIARKHGFRNLINRYQHKDGHEVFTESSGAPILDHQGKVSKWRGVDHDITERKRFEDALRLRDRAIEASSVGIIITDASQPNYPIIYANPAFLRMTGYSLTEVLGQNPRLLQGPDTDPRAIAEIRQALREGRDCHLTLKNYRKDGTPFWNELLISPVRDENGRLTHYVGIQTDVSELRRIEEQRHEMEIAKQIQLSLLPPSSLHVDGAVIAGFCLPAAHVGGDYFDYFCTPDTVDLVIADVSGHSVGAALIMAETRSTLRLETHRLRREREKQVAKRAAETLVVLNDLLFEDLNRADLFITMFYAQYHPVTRTLTYANAGHNCPLLLHRGEILELDAEGLILGVKKGVMFEQKECVLASGDLLLLYTDGVTEARNRAGEFFGICRLRELFAAYAHSSPQDLIEAVVQELRTFCQSQSFHDDISLVVLQIT